eukprot:9470100-Pyramimonas_sp.AAC.1
MTSEEAAGALQALHDHGALTKLALLPIMQPQFAWTLKIMSAIKHLAAFLNIQCEADGLGPARKAISQLTSTIVTDTLKACNAYRKEARQGRRDLDGSRMKNYMDLDTAKRTLTEAMCDLHAVWTIYKDADSIPPFFQRVASIAMAWAVVIPGTFGRSGELEGLFEEEVLQSRADGKSYVEIKRHKT